MIYHFYDEDNNPVTKIYANSDLTKLSTPYGERGPGTRTEVHNVLDFTLKGYDKEIEAVRMGHRFYDPLAKRFLAADSYFLENSDKISKSP